MHPAKLSAQETKGRNYTLLAVLGGIVASIMILACTPPFSRDALIHHLQVPKLYLLHGGIYEISELIFSYYPMNLDLLYMGALHFGSDIFAKYIHMTFGFATVLLLYRYLKKRLSTSYAYLGAIFFLSIPIIVKLAITVYVDLGLVFFSTASLLLLFQWIETGYRKKFLLLAGICCGLGIGTKYNGLLVLFIVSFMVPVLCIRSQEQNKKAVGTAIKAAIFFCFAAGLTASPWLIRNTIWTGNPVYPLYNSFFNPSVTKGEKIKTEEAKINTAIQGVFAKRYVLYKENIWQLLLLPVRIFFEGRDDDPRYFDGRLNPFLFLLPFVIFFRRKKPDRHVRLEQITLSAFCLLYFLFAFNTGVLRIRYLVPIIPFLVILSMYGLSNLEVLTKQYLKNRNLAVLIWLLLVSLLLAWNGSYIYQQFKKVDPFSYISGRLSRDEYLTGQLPEYRIMQYANNNVPDSAKILCIFMGWRGYYLNRAHSFDHHNNPDALLAWLQEPSMTVNKIEELLAENEIGYLLIRKDLLGEWLRRAETNSQMLWSVLGKNHLLPLASDHAYILYQISLN